eukprot:c7210_g1_i1 orf=158-721(+)
MRPLVRTSYPGLPSPWLERRGRGDRCCPPATFCIRKLHSPGKKSSSIFATGKPRSKGVSKEEEEMDDETTNADATEIPVTAPMNKSSASETRSRKSVWQRLKLGLGLGFQNEGKLASADTGDMDIEWSDIVDPTPENLLALLLTGLLGLAILQIFWQLLLVAITITLAALKYSVIAVILLALLIVLL